MKLCDFSIENFNSSMHGSIINKTLNFCNAVVLSHKKMSVTLKYDFRNYLDEYATLDSDLNCKYSTNFENYYYGCSPKIDSFLILDAISDLSFRTQESLENFVSEHCTEFMLHKSHAGYLPDLAKLILLTIASKYGIVLKLNQSSSFILDMKDKFPDIVQIFESENKVEIHGCPTAELIECFNSLCFENNDGMWEISDQGISFPEIYSNKSNIKLLVGRVFYSGVLIKPIHIYKAPKDYESHNITNIIISYERSTFAAVCAFDDNRINHPLLKKSKANLIKMFSEDENYKREMYAGLTDNDPGEDQIVSVINNYLVDSLNVNQIGVSGNITTADNKIFFGLRGSGNIDDGFVYPGVNGNAELYDKNVDFYNRSVYEDLPSITIDDARCDLLGEISRETYGELHLNQREESWECYGIVISGTTPFLESYSHKHRRCHFNLLFENKIDISFESVKEYQKKASEDFENKSFITLTPKFYKNRLNHLLISAGEWVGKITKSKDFIESVLLLTVTAISISSSSFSLNNFSHILSLVFASLILITNVIHIIKQLSFIFKNSKVNKVLCIYEDMSYEDVCVVVASAFGNSYHPVAYASLKLHIENKLYARLAKKIKKTV